MPRALKVYTELFEFDSAIRTQYPVFCGVDEAGRGPLAGDVYAAAVILPEGLEIPGLNDSKKLSEKRREELAPIIREQAAAWCIASATVAEIEELNILQAALLAMQRAVALRLHRCLRKPPVTRHSANWMHSIRSTVLRRTRATARRRTMLQSTNTVSVRRTARPF